MIRRPFTGPLSAAGGVVVGADTAAGGRGGERQDGGDAGEPRRAFTAVSLVCGVRSSSACRAPGAGVTVTNANSVVLIVLTPKMARSGRRQHNQAVTARWRPRLARRRWTLAGRMLAMQLLIVLVVLIGVAAASLAQSNRASARPRASVPAPSPTTWPSRLACGVRLPRTGNSLARPGPVPGGVRPDLLRFDVRHGGLAGPACHRLHRSVTEELGPIGCSRPTRSWAGAGWGMTRRPVPRSRWRRSSRGVRGNRWRGGGRPAVPLPAGQPT